MTVPTMANTLKEALRHRPQRFLVSSWPMRALAYVLSSVATGVLALIWLPIALLAGAVVATPLLTSPLAALERRRAGLLGGPPIPSPHRQPDGARLVAGIRSSYAESTTWRGLAYLVLHATVLLSAALAAITLGVVPMLLFFSGGLTVLIGDGQLDTTTPTAGGSEITSIFLFALTSAAIVIVTAVLAAYSCALAAVLHGDVARRLLGPGDEVRVRVLTESRARLVDAFETERRRIERDLHDGAQQRLLHLGMTLVTARLELDHAPEVAKSLMTQAAQEAKAALAELRELVRGIHPQVLTDLGLPAAIAELADRSTIPVTVKVDVASRSEPAVESAAYFVIAEALANAVKHAQATRVTITGRLNAGRLLIEVCDDGIGGANPDHGSGLTGLADRVEALDGTLTLTSPPGGPTLLNLELPCSA